MLLEQERILDLVMTLNRLCMAYEKEVIDLCRRIVEFDAGGSTLHPEMKAKQQDAAIATNKPDAATTTRAPCCRDCRYQSFRLCQSADGPNRNTLVDLKDVCPEFMPRIPTPPRRAPATPPPAVIEPGRVHRQRVVCPECGKETAARAQGGELLVWKHPAKNGKGDCPGGGRPGEPA